MCEQLRLQAFALVFVMSLIAISYLLAENKLMATMVIE